MSDFVIETDRLTKFYGQKCAVDQVSLTVPRGSVYALMGRNGSGKTTTIRMLLGLVTPTRGTASVLGRSSLDLTPDVRSRIGYLSESHYVYRWMKIAECAKFQQSTFARWNQTIFDAVVDHFGLDRKTKAGALSRGERAGLCLAMTLGTDPDLLILDDPALGLDPVARRSLVEAMLAVTSHNERTILFSSHLLDDVERVADHVGIIDQGVLRVQTSVDDFRERICQWRLTFETLPSALPALTGLVHTEYLDNEIRVTIANSNDETEATLRSLNPRQMEKCGVGLERAVIDYLTTRGRSGSLLQAVGAVRSTDESPQQIAAVSEQTI
ncbi:MAG: ABC transporter ATP-binding protein [Fuerstiella sp.]